ncbi:MAG: J domain-containing protein [Anaerolineales bacterium]|nr:J domain-containing protein [Anaerolineales bacterium]
MKVQDYYQTLGVSKDADAKAIKKAYRKLARQYHPDVNPGDKSAEERFKSINEAYEVLGDPEKRKKYDQFGAQWQQYERAGGRPEDFNWSQWATQPGGRGQSYTRTVSPEEFAQMFGGSSGSGGFSDFFETLFGGMGQQRASGFGFNDVSGRPSYQPRARQGRDTEHTVQITLEEAFQGTTRTLQWENGRTIQAKIPRGVDTGSRIRLSGQGESGQAGGQSGDLYLIVEVLPHAVYQREGDDLQMEVPVDLYTAVLGGQVEVRTIDKSVNLTIPPETANDKLFRLGGLGMPKLRQPDKRGDLYVTVKVTLPQNLTAKEKELFGELRTLRA